MCWQPSVSKPLASVDVKLGEGVVMGESGTAEKTLASVYMRGEEKHIRRAHGEETAPFKQKTPKVGWGGQLVEGIYGAGAKSRAALEVTAYSRFWSSSSASEASSSVAATSPSTRESRGGPWRYSMPPPAYEETRQQDPHAEDWSDADADDPQLVTPSTSRNSTLHSFPRRRRPRPIVRCHSRPLLQYHTHRHHHHHQHHHHHLLPFRSTTRSMPHITVLDPDDLPPGDRSPRDLNTTKLAQEGADPAMPAREGSPTINGEGEDEDEVSRRISSMCERMECMIEEGRRALEDDLTGGSGIAGWVDASPILG